MSGPYSVVLTFAGKPKEFTAHQLHGAFLDLCRRADPALAQVLHSGIKRRPFSLHVIGPRPAEEVHLRLSILAPELFQRFWRRWEARGGLPLRLDRQLLRPKEVKTTGPWAGGLDWRDFWSLPAAKTIRFRFCTPTTFRQGDLDLPLPIPTLVFKSLLELWNLHAPKAIALSPEILERGVALTSCRVRTQRFFDGYATILGFVGQCEFRLTKVLSGEEAQALRALAGFAFFSGVGRKTTHGMGLVRVEFGGKSWPS